jgi:hypothetical protein
MFLEEDGVGGIMFIFLTLKIKCIYDAHFIFSIFLLFLNYFCIINKIKKNLKLLLKLFDT